MVTLRCTRLVYERLRLPRQTAAELPPSTGRLGDDGRHFRGNADC